MAPATIRLIVNPAAGGGRGRRVAGAVEQALRREGLTVNSVQTRDLEHARALGRAAALAGETAVALSGDGMFGALADELREVPGAILGVLPGGRGNDLARVLGIADDPVAACKTIAAGVARTIDLGLVSAASSQRLDSPARAFVGIASVGFDSVANRIANDASAWLGGLVYAYGALRALLSWRPARFEIELDPPAARLRFSAYTVGAANSKTYGGGMRAAPDALLDDGLLEVLVLESVGKLAFVTRILPKVFKGTHVRDPKVHVFRAREVAISADRPFTMYADGDPIGELPLRVRALPAAITMLVPPHSDAPGAFAKATSQLPRTSPAGPPAGARQPADGPPDER